MKQWFFLIFSVLFLVSCQGMEALEFVSLNSVESETETSTQSSSGNPPTTLGNPNPPLTPGSPENPNPPPTTRPPNPVPPTTQPPNPAPPTTQPPNPAPPTTQPPNPAPPTTRPPNPAPPTTRPPNPEPPGDECPSRAYCFEEEGLFHRPTQNRPGNNQFILDDLPARTYQRIHVTMQFKISSWSLIRAAGIHNIFWLAIDRHNDLIGYFNATGPDARGNGGLVFRHGVDLVHGDKPKVTKPILLQKQTTYTVSYDYDTQYNRISLKLFNQNQRLVTEIKHQPNIPHITLRSNNRIRIHFGNTETVFNAPGCSVIEESTMGFNMPGCWAVEVPSFGWEYKNLKAIVYY